MDREGFKNRLKQYKQAREENPGLKYWEWKNIPKYDEGTDDAYDAGTLPEVVVTPEEWQKDFSKNFADARIRKNIYRGMPVYAKQTELFNLKKEYVKLNKLGQFTEESRKHFKNEVDNLQKDYHAFINDPDHTYQNANDEIKRLYNIWNFAGRPKITSKNSIFGDVFNIKNPHWNPINNSIYNSGNINTIVSELAHPIQYKAGDKNRLVDYVLGFPKAIYGYFTKYNAYGDENHYEYDTHSNVEPALREYIAHGKNTKYLNSFAEGGEVGQRQLILSRANKVATNYSDAKDFTLDPLNYAVRKIAKTLTGRGGISNCTLSATGWIDPNNQYMSAKNIFDNPGSGYTEIDKAYALPGDLLIAKNPKEGSYHTMLIERFNGDDPVLRYSRGGHNTEKNLVTGRSLEEYHRLDNEQGGNHTEDHYFRYNLPNEYWLPEIVVTPKK